MSEPKRYDVGMTTEFNPHGFNHSFPRVYEAEQGKYVLHADYTRLKAEVERLEKQNEIYNDVTADVITERDSLKAEVERLSGQAKYWRIEAETDHARWLRVLEENEALRKKGAQS